MCCVLLVTVCTFVNCRLRTSDSAFCSSVTSCACTCQTQTSVHFVLLNSVRVCMCMLTVDIGHQKVHFVVLLYLVVYM